VREARSAHDDIAVGILRPGPFHEKIAVCRFRFPVEGERGVARLRGQGQEAAPVRGQKGTVPEARSSADHRHGRPGLGYPRLNRLCLQSLRKRAGKGLRDEVVDEEYPRAGKARAEARNVHVPGDVRQRGAGVLLDGARNGKDHDVPGHSRRYGLKAEGPVDEVVEGRGVRGLQFHPVDA